MKNGHYSFKIKQCTDPVDENRLNELDELKCDLETDWNEIVVENDESQQTEEKVRLFEI